MIVRVFRVVIHREFKEDFEKDFERISLPLVKAQEGLVSLSFGKVISQGSDEYALITTWQDQDALVAFCGQAWEQAVIPHGMERYIQECSVYHFEQLSQA